MSNPEVRTTKTRRRYTTSQVIELLAAHNDWVFVAPDTCDHCQSVASTDGMFVQCITSFDEHCGGDVDGGIPLRSDWFRRRRRDSDRT